jgi:hypothetical protein
MKSGVGLYDDRRGTLDPGLTALVLRARRDAARYPFLEGAVRRRWWVVGAGVLTEWLAAWRPRRGRPRRGQNGLRS